MSKFKDIGKRQDTEAMDFINIQVALSKLLLNLAGGKKNYSAIPDIHRKSGFLSDKIYQRKTDIGKIPQISLTKDEKTYEGKSSYGTLPSIGVDISDLEIGGGATLSATSEGDIELINPKSPLGFQVYRDAGDKNLNAILKGNKWTLGGSTSGEFAGEARTSIGDFYADTEGSIAYEGDNLSLAKDHGGISGSYRGDSYNVNLNDRNLEYSDPNRRIGIGKGLDRISYEDKDKNINIDKANKLLNVSFKGNATNIKELTLGKWEQGIHFKTGTGLLSIYRNPNETGLTYENKVLKEDGSTFNIEGNAFVGENNSGMFIKLGVPLQEGTSPAYHAEMQGELAGNEIGRYYQEGGFIDMQEGGDVENPFEGIEIGIDPPSQIPPDAFIPPPIGINPPDDDWGIEPPMPILPDPTVPDVTSEVKPDTTIQPTEPIDDSLPVDTTQGFYSVNPAPDETLDEFEMRTAKFQTLEDPIEILKDPHKEWQAPEGYVSPRISNSFSDVFGYGGDGSSLDYSITDTGTGTGSDYIPPEPDKGLSASQIALINMIGTIGDVQLGDSALTRNLDVGPNFTVADYIDSINPEDFDFNNMEGLSGLYGVDFDFTDKVDAWLEEVNYTRHPDKHFTLDNAISFVAFQETLEEISSFDVRGVFDVTFGKEDWGGITVNPDGTLKSSGVLPGSSLWGAQNPAIADRGGVSFNLLDENLEASEVFNTLGSNVDLGKFGIGDKFASQINTDVSVPTTITGMLNQESGANWFSSVGKTTLGEMFGQDLQLQDLYDDFGAALIAGYITGDAETALKAGVTQFIKTDVIEKSSSAWGQRSLDLVQNQISAATTVADINTFLKTQTGIDYNLASDLDLQTAKNTAEDVIRGQASGKFEAFGTAAASVFQVLAMGGSAEDAVLAGGESLAVYYGADMVGQALGLSTTAPAFGGASGSAGAQGASAAGVGGAAIIAAVATLIRTGDVTEAAKSAALSAAFAFNPVLGSFLMIAQVMAASEPSNKAAYTNLNFSDMSTVDFNQGEYDVSKAAPENQRYTKLIMAPIQSEIQAIMDKYNVTFQGDLQLEYGHKFGLRWGFYDKDITGFKQRGDFTEETGDVASGRDVRQKIEPSEKGIKAYQKWLLSMLEYGAKNGITNVTDIVPAYYAETKENRREVGALDYGIDPATFSYSSITSPEGEIPTSTYTKGTDIGSKKGGKISLDKGSDSQYNSKQYGFVNQKDKAPPSQRADDVPMDLKEGDFVLSQPAVALYGKDTVDRMLSRAATSAGTNLKSGGKVPVNVHNGEYVIPKELTKYIGQGVLNTMNDKGLMSVGERPNT